MSCKISSGLEVAFGYPMDLPNGRSGAAVGRIVSQGPLLLIDVLDEDTIGRVHFRLLLDCQVDSLVRSLEALGHHLHHIVHRPISALEVHANGSRRALCKAFVATPSGSVRSFSKLFMRKRLASFAAAHAAILPGLGLGLG